ncbi:MAG: ABC transporter permease [Phycisphaerales bacterium]|nr:ABC transporter permease [Phycisphaerales bacterium]
MRSILLIAIKDLRVVAHDKIGLFFIVAFPVLMGVLFGFMSSSFSSDSESVQLEIAVIDGDQSAMSRRFIKALEDTGNVKVRTDLGDRSAVIDAIRRGRLLGFIGLPAGFGETVGIMWMEQPAIELGVDPSRSSEAGLLKGMIMQASGELMGERFMDPDSMRPMIEQSRRDILADDSLSPAARALLGGFMGTLDGFLGSLDQLNEGLEAEGEGGGRPSMQLATIKMVDVTAPKAADDLLDRLRSPWDISFPSAMLWGVLACAAAFAITMVRERTQGTFARLKVAPIARFHILTGKGAACFAAVVLVNVLMIALGLALGMRPGSYSLLALAVVCVACCFVGIMMLMSVIGRSEEAVGGAAWGANVTMALFGGGMIPLAFMPPVMQTASHFSPVKWGVLALEGAIWRGFSLTEMLLPCAILITIGAAGTIVGSVILNRAAD